MAVSSVRSLGPAVALAVALVLSGPATAQVSGSFGLLFNQPVSDDVLAASFQPAPELPSTARGSDASATADLTNVRWHYFKPQAVPEPLRRAQTTYQVLVNERQLPLVIVVYAALDSCAVTDWLTATLERKYTTKSRAHADLSYIEVDRREVYWQCTPSPAGHRLVLEYRDEGAIFALRSAAKISNGSEGQLERAKQQVDLARRRAYADRFTLGDRHRLLGGLGLLFDQPVQNQISLTTFSADESTPLTGLELPDSLLGATVVATLSPKGYLVRLEAKVADPQQTALDTLARALEAKYGAPMKNTRKHQIYRINGDLVILRHTAQHTRLVLLDRAAKTAQDERLQAASDARWEESATGL